MSENHENRRLFDLTKGEYLSLYQDEHLTRRQVAKQFDCSRQALNQFEAKHSIRMDQSEIYLNRYRQVLSIIQEKAKEGVTRKSVYTELGLHHTVFTNILEKAGIEWVDPVRELGCKRCKTEHFARGLCHACYQYAWRNGLLEAADG